MVGREFEFELLVEVSGRPGEDVIAALESAVEAGLLIDVPGTLRPLRLLPRPVSPDDLLGHLQGAPRAAAPAARRGAGAPPRQRTPPRRGARPPLLRRRADGAAKALEYCVRAGASALGAFAYEEAHRALRPRPRRPGRLGIRRREAALRAPDRPRRGRVAGRRPAGRPRHLLPRRADRPARRRLRGAGPRGARLLRLRLERVQGPDPEADELLEGALEADPEPGVLRARVLARLAEALHFAGEDERADEVSREAVSTPATAATRRRSPPR